MIVAIERSPSIKDIPGGKQQNPRQKSRNQANPNFRNSKRQFFSRGAGGQPSGVRLGFRGATFGISNELSANDGPASGHDPLCISRRLRMVERVFPPSRAMVSGLTGSIRMRSTPIQRVAVRRQMHSLTRFLRASGAVMHAASRSTNKQMHVTKTLQGE